MCPIRVYTAEKIRRSQMKLSFCLLVAFTMTAMTTQSQAKDDLIPRKLLFGNPDRAALQISHDGKFLSFLAPVDGVLNVWVAPVGKLDDAKPITHDNKR